MVLAVLPAQVKRELEQMQRMKRDYDELRKNHDKLKVHIRRQL